MSLNTSAFLETIIAFLLPYFTTGARGMDEARTEIIQTLTSYATRTRAEMLQAAQIIALGMTTLDVLAEARTEDMSQSMRIRYLSCANRLNRSTIQTEKALDQRLAGDFLVAPQPLPPLVNDIPAAEVNRAVGRMPAAIDSHPDRMPGARPATGMNPMSKPDQNKQLWSGAMLDTLKQMGIPTQSGLHAGG